MKAYSLSNKAGPANGTTVGTVQPTTTDAPTYALTNKTPPANYAANSAAAPTVTTADPVTARRRSLILMAS